MFSFWGVAAFTALSFLYYLVALVQTPLVEAIGPLKEHSVIEPTSKIFLGPLALKENIRSPLAIALEQKLSFLAQSMRPDLAGEQKVFRIGIVGTDSEAIIQEGEPIFLEVNELSPSSADQIRFSNKGLALVPHIIDGRSLLLKGERMELLLKSAKVQLGSKDEEVKALIGAKWIGIDRLFEYYGGDHYQALGKKQKICVGQGASRYTLFVSTGDFLSYQDGRWKVLSSLEEADRNSLLAQVTLIGDRGIELEGWDANGFPLFQEALSPTKAVPVQVQADQLVLDPKLRSAKQISCQMDQKRMLLKEGDWLLKCTTGWQKLKTLDEIQAVLSEEIVGELFIVDEIDAKGILNGNYFDKERLQRCPISMGIQAKAQTLPGQNVAPSILKNKRRRHLSKL